MSAADQPIATADQIVAAALTLPEAERMRVLHEVERSLAPHGLLTEGEPGFFEELDRRVAEHDSDPSTAIPWETVRNELAERLKGGATR